MLDINEKMPSFSLMGSDGRIHDSKELERGNTIIFFYPKDMTPGCTMHVSGYRNLFDAFSNEGYRIVGISPDSISRHEKFIEKENIPYILLSDPDKETAKLFGAFGIKKLYGKETEGIIRSSFIFKDGILMKRTYNTKAKEDASCSLSFIKDGVR